MHMNGHVSNLVHAYTARFVRIIQAREVSWFCSDICRVSIFYFLIEHIRKSANARFSTRAFLLPTIADLASIPRVCRRQSHRFRLFRQLARFSRCFQRAKW